jgi:hypothetical protein
MYLEPVAASATGATYQHDILQMCIAKARSSGPDFRSCNFLSCLFSDSDAESSCNSVTPALAKSTTRSFSCLQGGALCVRVCVCVCLCVCVCVCVCMRVCVCACVSTV